MMPVHTLIIPKEHHANIGDDVPDELMGHLFNTVKKVAQNSKGIAETAIASSSIPEMTPNSSSTISMSMCSAAHP